MFLICQNIIILCTIFLASTKDMYFGLGWKQKFEITRNLSEALVEMISELYVGSFQQRVFNFQVKVKIRNRPHLWEFQEIIDETILSLNESIGVQLRNDLVIPPDNERHFCVLLVDSSKSLEYLYKDLNKYHLFVKGSYVIILQTYPNVHHYYNELFDILQLCWRNGISQASVIVHAVNNVILLFHSMPFTPFHCKGVAPVIHNKFIDGHWLHKAFYTSKAQNLHGCPLVCATWEDMPYFQVSRDLSKGKYIGLEGKLMEYLADKMNFTIEIRWLNDNEINQTIYDEQGVFNKLFSNGTDFVIGAFNYKTTSLEDPYAPTTGYYLSRYYFIVSSKTDAYDPFAKLLLPFEMEIWITLIIIFLIANTVLCVVMYHNQKFKSLVLGKDNSSPAYNMIVISLGGAVAKDPKVPFSRFLLMKWVLATFVLRTIYQGYMFHFIKSDLRKPPPQLISELMRKEYRIFVSEVVYTSITDLPHLYNKAEVLNTSELDSFEMLRHPKDYGSHKLAILTPLEYFGYYKFIRPINYDFYVVPEKLFTQQLSIYMKKNSVYLKRFNSYIQTYLNEGLMNYWDRFLVSSGNKRRKKDDSPMPMKNSHLFAAYRLLFIGLTASIFAFLTEVIVYEVIYLTRSLRKKNSKRNIK